MKKIILILCLLDLVSCAHVTDGKTSLSLEFGKIIGPYLPHLVIAVEFHQSQEVTAPGESPRAVPDIAFTPGTP